MLIYSFSSRFCVLLRPRTFSSSLAPRTEQAWWSTRSSKELNVNVRGFIRNVTKARERLEWVACDASEGTFVGDVHIPAPSLHPWIVLTVSSTRRGRRWFTLMSPIFEVLLSQWWSSHRRGFQRGYELAECSRERTSCRRSSRTSLSSPVAWPWLWVLSKSLLSDTTTRWLSCQIPLHVRTLRACACKILHSGDPRTHAPNDASGGTGTVIYAIWKTVLLSLDDALEDFSFQIDAHTVFAPGWDDNFLAHWADTATNIPYGRRIHSRVWLQMGAAKRIVHEQCLCGARFEGAGIVRKWRAKLRWFWSAQRWQSSGRPGLNFSRSHAERRTFPQTFMRDTSFWARNSIALLGCGLTATFCTAPLGLSLLWGMKVTRRLASATGSQTTRRRKLLRSGWGLCCELLTQTSRSRSRATSVEDWSISRQSSSAARNLISIAHPASLFLAGSGGACLRGEYGPGSCYACTAAQVPHSFSGGVEPIMSAPSLSYWRGPVSPTPALWTSRNVSVLRSTRANFGWRDFKELSSGAGHFFHSVSRLQHSGEVGVLVSLVLILTLLLCSSFSRFTVKTLSRELRDVDV